MLLIGSLMTITANYTLFMISNSLLPLYTKEHFPQFNMKMQGFIISGWQVTFAFFSPVAAYLLNRIGQKNTLIFSVVLEIVSCLCFALFSYISNPWAFWILNFVARLFEGAADTTTAIAVTTIISCEFAEKADLYYGLVHIFWAGGYIIGPIITLIVYDSLGYAGIFFFIAVLIAIFGLVPSICMIPSRLNKLDESPVTTQLK